MSQVVLDIGDASVTVDTVAVSVAVTTPAHQVKVETPQAAVAVDVSTPAAVVVDAPQADIQVYASTPNITVSPAGTPGMQGEQGPQGIQGPPGSGSLAAQYIHNQTMLSPTWVLEHNMGKHPEVTCEDGAGSVIYGSVTHLDDNTALVGFAFSITGRANCT